MTLEDLPSMKAILWYPYGDMTQYWDADQLNYLLGLLGEDHMRKRFCRVYDCRERFVGVIER